MAHPHYQPYAGPPPPRGYGGFQGAPLPSHHGPPPMFGHGGRPMPHMGPPPPGFPGMGPPAPEVETRRLGFDDPDDDKPPTDAEGLLFPEPSENDLIKTIAVMNITKSFSDRDMQAIANIGGGLIQWMRDIKPNGLEWQPRGIAMYQDVDTLCIARAILGEARVVRKKDPQDAKTDEKVNGAAKDGDKAEADTVKNGETAEEDEEEYDQLRAIPDYQQPDYIAHWRDNGSALSEEELQPRIDSARAALKQLCENISERNRNAGRAVENKGVETEQVTDEATGQIITITKTGEDDDLTNVPEEYRPRVLEEIAAFRERSKIREAEKAQKEQDEKDAQAQLSSIRPSRLADDTDINGGLPKGPKGVPLGPKSRTKKGDWNGEKLFDMTLWDRKEGEESLTLKEVYDRRFEERIKEADARFPDMLRKWKMRESRTADARKREADREAREKQEEEEFQKTLSEQKDWLLSHDEEAEKKSKKPYHPSYADPEGYKRKMRSVWEAERLFDEADREAEARETAEAEERRKRDQRAAESFLDQQAEELQQSQAPSAPFKLSLGAAAAKQSAQRRNLAMAESLLEDDDEIEAAQQKRVLKPLNPNAQITPGKLTDEEKQEMQNELATEIPRDSAQLFAWAVNWESLSDKMVEEQLRPWLEKKFFDLFSVKDEELLSATEGNLRAKFTPQMFIDNLKELLDEEEAQEFVYKMWRLLVFYTEASKRGIM